MNMAEAQPNRRILIVDDNENIHYTFRKALAERSSPESLSALEAVLFETERMQCAPAFTVDSAYQGEEGLAMLRKARARGQPYAVVFVDVRMPPGWDGVQTLRRMWQEDNTLQAVICTAFSDYSWDGMVEQLGQMDRLLILKKPFDVIEVRQMAWALSEKWNAEHRAAERMAALRLSQQRFQAMVDHSPAIIYLKDTQGRFVLVNRRFEELFHITSEEVIGKTDHDVFAPPYADRLRANDLAVLAASRPLEFEEVTPGKGGEHAYISVKFPLLDPQGQPYAVGGISTDITERKRSETTLAFLEKAGRRLATTLDTVQVARAAAELGLDHLTDACVIQLSDELAPLRAGKRSCFVVTHRLSGRAESIEKELLERGARPESAAHLATVQETRQTLITVPAPALTAEEPACAWVVSVPLMGREVLLGTFSFFSNRPGASEGVDRLLFEELARRCALALDNAHLYQAAQEAIQAREEFLSVAAHELRTPLMPLKLQIQALRRLTQRPAGQSAANEAQASEDARVTSMFKVFDRQVSRLAHLIEELLDLNRLSQGTLDLRRERMDLAQLGSELVDLFRAEFRLAGCEVCFSSEGPAVGEWDRLQLERLVSNLLTNAAKFGGGNPVEVSVTTRGTRARLTVRDHGTGISPDDQAHIFEKFQRAKATRHINGCGLGLYIARQIAEAHGGAITVESTPGAGSAFTVEFPMSRPSV